MPHVSGHKEQTGLMSNPYKQAAESMKSVGIKSLSGVTTSSPKGQQAQQKQRESGFKPIRDYNTGPVGGSGNGRWNAGFDDDEESKSWDSLQNNPNKNIFVTGCAAQINPNKFNMMKEVDLMIGNNQKIQEETWKNFKLVKKQKFENIMAQQIPNNVKKKKADFIVDTSISIEDARNQVANIVKKIIS